jgi:hypothetical protein
MRSARGGWKGRREGGREGELEVGEERQEREKTVFIQCKGGRKRGREGRRTSYLRVDVVMEDVIEGGHEDNARGQGGVGLIQALQEEGDPHLEQGLKVHAFLLIACAGDFSLARRHLVEIEK